MEETKKHLVTAIVGFLARELKNTTGDQATDQFKVIVTKAKNVQKFTSSNPFL